MKKVYINIPVRDITASTVFYTGLGFEKQEDFSDSNGVGMKWSDTIFVMLLNHDFAKHFIEDREIVDAHTSFGSLFSFEFESKEGVDETVAKARELGAHTYQNKYNEQFDFMYGTSIVDPDGNILEMFYLDVSKFPGNNEN